MNVYLYVNISLYMHCVYLCVQVFNYGHVYMCVNMSLCVDLNVDICVNMSIALCEWYVCVDMFVNVGECLPFSSSLQSLLSLYLCLYPQCGAYTTLFSQDCLTKAHLTWTRLREPCLFFLWISILLEKIRTKFQEDLFSL